MKMLKGKKRKGFTLMEIIIVVIIIGILAMLIAPKFMDATAKAKDNAALAEHRSILGIVALFRAESATNAVPTPSEIEGKYDGKLQYTEITGTGGTSGITITTTFPSGKNPEDPSTGTKVTNVTP